VQCSQINKILRHSVRFFLSIESFNPKLITFEVSFVSINNEHYIFTAFINLC